MSSMTFWARALPATRVAARAEAPDKKKRRLVIMDVPDYPLQFFRWPECSRPLKRNPEGDLIFGRQS
jgi:hypothetical protein